MFYYYGFTNYDSTVGKWCQLQIVILHIALITICNFFSGKKLQFVYCHLFPSRHSLMSKCRSNGIGHSGMPDAEHPSFLEFCKVTCLALGLARDNYELGSEIN